LGVLILAGLYLTFSACLGLPGAVAQTNTADRVWVLDTLKRWSPDGWHIVDTYVKRVPDGTDFMEYWDGGKDDQRWDSLNTIVHELAHGYMGELADWDSVYYYVSPTESNMVGVGEVYRTQAMVPSIPQELRTFRFSYVDTDDTMLGSQTQGAYGLLNEMTAYWVGTQASADMLPLFEATAASASWQDFFNSVNGTLYGILEFRFFVLRYLMYAQEHEPAVYKDIMANKAFRKAFAAVDLRARDFVAGWLTKKPAIYEKIRKAGIGISEKDSMVMLEAPGEGSTGFGTFMDIYELLRLEMAKPAYTSLISLLYNGQNFAVWPDSGTKPAAQGNYDGKEGNDGSGEKGASISTGSVSGEDGDETPLSVPVAKPAGKLPTKPDLKKPAPKKPMGKVLFSLEGKDRKGDAREGYLDIVKATATLREDGAVFGLELATLPGKIPFDAAGLETGAVEYEWAFELDLDSDGRAEYSIGLSSFKPENRKPADLPILTRCRAQAWKVEADSASSIEVPLEAAIEGSAIILTLNDSAVLPLASFSEDSFITVRTHWDSGKESFSDSLEL